jgi:hypothetical protein
MDAFGAWFSVVMARSFVGRSAGNIHAIACRPRKAGSPPPQENVGRDTARTRTAHAWFDALSRARLVQMDSLTRCDPQTLRLG